ncbi:uncharacterized protein BDR25DRAFT_266475, partial [Lindgomyces ingoldianus]
MFPFKVLSMGEVAGIPVASPRSEDQTKMPGRKRKHINYDESDGEGSCCGEETPIKKPKTIETPDLSTRYTNSEPLPKNASRRKGKKAATTDGELKFEFTEKRQRRYRARPPQSYLEIKARALTQRLTIQHRERCGTDDVPEEKVLIAGTTGNIYSVHIGLIPTCDCPHARKGHQCKHIIYVMLRVLKAPENISFQLALTSSELRDIFANAAPIPKADTEADHCGGNRKPVEGDCPICYSEFELDKDAIVYCKVACGNNVHRDCMENWTRAKQGKATCPYCRAIWSEGGFVGKEADLQSAERNAEGYVNVASQLGLSGQRDYSSYHQPWVRQR